MEVSSLCCEQKRGRGSKAGSSTPTLDPDGNSHQDLEQDHEQLVTGHEVAVQDPEVEPAAQAAEHLDEHLLIAACFLHTGSLQHTNTRHGESEPAPEGPELVRSPVLPRSWDVLRRSGGGTAGVPVQAPSKHRLRQVRASRGTSCEFS